MSTSKTIGVRPATRKLFTVEEANATLPLVGAIVADLTTLSCEVTERRRRLALLLAGREQSQPRAHDPYWEELTQIEEEVEKDSRRLQEYVGELRSLGVEAASGFEGLVDFPALLDGRKVLLSWKLGEPQVAFWHEAGNAQRQRLPLAGKNLRIA